jgi:uncharacterized alpha-E superfamily protein
MIARVAESCFWLHRYMERVENTARLIQVNLGLVLDAHLAPGDQWRPILLALGEDGSFVQRLGPRAIDDGEVVQEFLTWDEENPAALLNSLQWARENARTIRETISVEMWQSLNAFWLWLSGGPGRRLYRGARHAFYERVKEYCQLFQGYYHGTMLYAAAFDFMRLGGLLERTGQTTRILQAMCHRLDSAAGEGTTPADAAFGLATLRSCSASESFLKMNRGPLSGASVAGFLLLEPAFPRSVVHCLDRCAHFLDRIRPIEQPEIGRRSASLLDTVLMLLRARRIQDLIRTGLAAELTTVLNSTAAIGDAIQEDFFEAVLPAPAPG